MALLGFSPVGRFALGEVTTPAPPATRGNTTSIGLLVNFDGSILTRTSEWTGWLTSPITLQPLTPPLPVGHWVLWDGSAQNLTNEISFNLGTPYAIQVTPATVRPPGRWTYWEGLKDPTRTVQDSQPRFSGSTPPPPIPAKYLLLVDHYLATGYTQAGTVVTEGVQIPVGWLPTLAVDPLNTSAVLAFWNNGPRGQQDAEKARDFFPFIPFTAPQVYWAAVPGQQGVYVLTGAGALLGNKT